MPRLVPEDLVRSANIIKNVATQEVQNELLPQINSELGIELANARLTTKDALGVVSTIMHEGRKDALKIVAAKLALQLNGVLNQDNEGVDKGTVVNFVFQDSNVNLNGIFNPRR